MDTFYDIKVIGRGGIFSKMTVYPIISVGIEKNIQEI